MGKVLKDFLLREEYEALRQYYENEIEMAEETGGDTYPLEERLETLDELWQQES